MSKNIDDVVRFYDSFSSRQELIQWMRIRPKPEVGLKELDGNKDIVVLILTANFNGRYVEHCINEIYPGLHTILIGGEGHNNSYFNPAYYLNSGIEKAIAYNPRWIIISSDDMRSIHSVDKLKSRLEVIDESKVDVVFTQPSKYHSIPNNLSGANFFRTLLFKLKRVRRRQLIIEKKFHVKLFPVPVKGIKHLFYRKGFYYVSMASFGIISGNLIKKIGTKIFDETFPIGGFDDDFSIRVIKENFTFTFIDYKIGDMFGSTLGTDMSRKFRDLAGLIYLNEKWRNIL